MRSRAVLLLALTVGAVAVTPAAAADVGLGACVLPPLLRWSFDHAGPDVFVGVYAGNGGASVYTDRREFQRRCDAG